MDLSYSGIVGVAHIGIAVQSIEIAFKEYELLGFKPINEDVVSESEYGVKSLMMDLDGYVIELLEPLIKGEGSPIDTYISSKPYKMYHLAYYVSDIDDAIGFFEKRKFVAISKPRLTSVLKERTVFLFNRNMGIVELIEKNSKGA